MLKLVRCVLLSVLCLAAVGCARPAGPPSASPSAAAGSPFPTLYPSPGAARGDISGTPFVVRTTLLWQDATATWLSFDDTVPLSDGRFDPRAQRPPTTCFLLYLDPAHLTKGRFEARDGQVPQDSPIRFAALQLVNGKTREVHLFDTTWTATLIVDDLIPRKAKSGPPGLDMAGAIDIRFTVPSATLSGPFIAHDLLRSDEVAPAQPPVPVPTSPDRTE